ncbi:MAG: PD40 domain-containing protein [Dehalococcoidia bacterium]|nr:MAG: PD40 domain-containing protein [Dehalococcoidia bacterium]
MGEDPVVPPDLWSPWTPEELGIIFVRSFKSGQDEIYGMNIDGSGQTNLSFNLADDRGPVLSPDGSQIAFYSNRDGDRASDNEIYVMNTDGTNQNRLTNNPGNDYKPVWSPDGSQILFQSTRGDDVIEIYVMNADGSNVTRLTNNLGSEYYPTWSPDGSQILFYYRTGYASADYNWDIYVMNADGSNLTNLTDNPAGNYKPVWSPDGSQILFYSNRDGNEEIYVMNADGSNQTRLTNNPSYDHKNPIWSNDGSRIAFEVTWGEFPTDQDNREIYVMNADGSNQIRLTDNSAFDGYLAWSPDDSMIAFASERDGSDNLTYKGDAKEIYVMNADGTNQIGLTDNSTYDNHPVWLH